jgi:hypothetical protein
LKKNYFQCLGESAPFNGFIPHFMGAFWSFHLFFGDMWRQEKTYTS